MYVYSFRKAKNINTPIAYRECRARAVQPGSRKASNGYVDIILVDSVCVLTHVPEPASLDNLKNVLEEFCSCLSLYITWWNKAILHHHAHSARTEQVVITYNILRTKDIANKWEIAQKDFLNYIDAVCSMLTSPLSAFETSVMIDTNLKRQRTRFPGAQSVGPRQGAVAKGAKTAGTLLARDSRVCLKF